MLYLVSKMVKLGTARKKEQFCRHIDQINVYTYLCMSILFCTFVVQIRTIRTFRSCARHEPSVFKYETNS